MCVSAWRLHDEARGQIKAQYLVEVLTFDQAQVQLSLGLIRQLVITAHPNFLTYSAPICSP